MTKHVQWATAIHDTSWCLMASPLTAAENVLIPPTTTQLGNLPPPKPHPRHLPTPPNLLWRFYPSLQSRWINSHLQPHRFTVLWRSSPTIVFILNWISREGAGWRKSNADRRGAAAAGGGQAGFAAAGKGREVKTFVQRRRTSAQRRLCFPLKRADPEV